MKRHFTIEVVGLKTFPHDTHLNILLHGAFKFTKLVRNLNVYSIHPVLRKSEACRSADIEMFNKHVIFTFYW